MKLTRIAVSIWTHLTGCVATVCGIAAVILLILQGVFLGAAAVGLIVGVRYVACCAIKRPRRPTAESLANWSGVHAITTAVCLVLPFYLSLSG
ncbi:MAG TPA: hypothetical protein VM118_09355 [Acidobacteriota bacterium]|nr:hypothetical protein [Acidobacteriota bacterium]